MDLDAFARKYVQITNQHGPITAGKMAVQEAIVKASLPYAHRKATPIWDAEWDVCLVLDACRFDLWTEVTDRFDNESRWSVGSHSLEWLNQTFSRTYDAEVRKTAYVTANPNAERTDDHAYVDADIFPLADRGFGYYDPVYRDAWPFSDELRTIGPEILTKRGLYAYQNAPTANVIVHYMQPHIPFKSHPEWSQGRDLHTDGGSGTDIWHQARDNDIPMDELWDAYAANLQWVLESVRTWIAKTNARILITSDHGNALGKFGQWGHPPGSANPYIRKIPWVIVHGTNEEEVVAADTHPPTQSQIRLLTTN